MATNYGAYAGKIIKVDLTTKLVTEYPYSDKERKLFLGGKIMAAKIMNDHLAELGVDGSFDPFSAENAIIVTTCPLNATGAPSSSRFNTSTISPLTGIYTSSNCGGNFGMHLKRAGYDALIIVGKADEHTLLRVSEDFKVVFENADALWGMKTGHAQEHIKGDGGKFVIGPAGENLVRYACVISEERAAGRGGVGAVFGSKNLKGIYCKGTKSPTLHNKKLFKKTLNDWVGAILRHPLTGLQVPTMGTAALIAPMHTKNLLATNNYRSGKYEKFEDISGERMSEEYLVRRNGCISCPMQCARFVEVNGKVVKGPEVETVGLFGANLRNNDLRKILDWNNELDEWGMDTISCGNTIAYAMEANEKGLWDNGLNFENKDNISEAIELIATKKGIGVDLGQGSKRCAEKYGGMEFAMQAKGMELAAYEPRGAVGQGLGYAVANRGGCHLNAGYLVILEGLGLAIDPYTPKAKAALTCMFQNLMEATSAGGNCLFTTYAFFPAFLIKSPNSIATSVINKGATKVGMVIRFLLRFPRLVYMHMPFNMLPHTKAITTATGMTVKFGEFLRIGERGYNLERMIDVKLGISSKDDTLPKRLTDELQIKGDKRTAVPLDVMKAEYYKLRGWDSNGIPTKKVLKRLKLEDVVK